MTRQTIAIPADITVAEAARNISERSFSTYPVVEANNRLAGVVSEVRLRRTIAEGGGNRPVREIAQRADHIYPDQPLVRAVIRMDKSNVRQLAVVNRGEERNLVGVLTMTDIVHAQARVASDAGEAERTVAPDASALIPAQDEQNTNP